MKTMEIFVPPSGQKTPAGGVKAEIYYFDENNCPVSKEKAKLAKIRELDKDGNLINETVGTIGRQKHDLRHRY